MIPLDAASIADLPDDLPLPRRPARPHAAGGTSRSELVDLHVTARRIVAAHWDLLGLDDPWPHIDCPARALPPRTEPR